MPRIDVGGGLSLNVERAGAGHPVVLLHGFTGASTSWQFMAAALAERAQPIAIDIVGHGRSDSPPEVDRYRMRPAVDDLVAALASTDHDTGAVWLGYSMGARVALQVAVHRPEAVTALILEGGSPGLADPAERAARVASDEALADRIEREGLEAFVDYWQSIPLWDSQQRLPAEVHAALRRQRLANDPVGLANSLRGMGTGAQDPLHDRLAAVAVPTLLVTGALDLKFTQIAAEMAVAMPRAETCVIPEAGHAAHLEQPAAFQAAVFAFLDRLDAGR
jgi:2-succinyl-6-hydroxy-2,4-cyclohexadiene-1-carboxylate synthase